MPLFRLGAISLIIIQNIGIDGIPFFLSLVTILVLGFILTWYQYNEKKNLKMKLSSTYRHMNHIAKTLPSSIVNGYGNEQKNAILYLIKKNGESELSLNNVSIVIHFMIESIIKILVLLNIIYIFNSMEKMTGIMPIWQCFLTASFSIWDIFSRCSDIIQSGADWGTLEGYLETYKREGFCDRDDMSSTNALQDFMSKDIDISQNDSNLIHLTGRSGDGKTTYIKSIIFDFYRLYLKLCSNL